jgi:putative toxin-antitoxin system antitoxin component (TIGR02293 family)
MSVFAGDTSDLIARMRSGVAADVVLVLAEKLGVGQKRLLDLLQLRQHAVGRRIRENGTLSPTEQDRLYRAEKVLVRAVQVLEDGDSARRWLTRANRSLGGEVPLALLDTQAGYEMILDTLRRIEYGAVS